MVVCTFHVGSCSTCAECLHLGTYISWIKCACESSGIVCPTLVGAYLALCVLLLLCIMWIRGSLDRRCPWYAPVIRALDKGVARPNKLFLAEWVACKSLFSSWCTGYLQYAPAALAALPAGVPYVRCPALPWLPLSWWPLLFTCPLCPIILFQKVTKNWYVPCFSQFRKVCKNE